MAKIANKVKTPQSVTFTFEDKAGTTYEIKLADFSDTIVQALAVHGISQKLGDSYSGITSVSEAIEKFEDTIANLKAGNFNVRASGSGNQLLAEAVARIKGLEVEEASKLLKDLDEEAIGKLKKHSTVKQTIVIIKGERASAGIDGTEELEI